MSSDNTDETDAPDPPWIATTQRDARALLDAWRAADTDAQAVQAALDTAGIAAVAVAHLDTTGTPAVLVRVSVRDRSRLATLLTDQPSSGYGYAA